MARNKVDLPEPGGAGDQRCRACLDRQPLGTYDVPPIRQTQYNVTQHKITSEMLSAFDARWFRAKPPRLVDSRAKCRQTFDNGLVRRQRLVARDKESERGFDPAKGAGRLRHLSKDDLPEEEVRRNDNIGDH